MNNLNNNNNTLEPIPFENKKKSKILQSLLMYSFLSIASIFLGDPLLLVSILLVFILVSISSLIRKEILKNTLLKHRTIMTRMSLLFILRPIRIYIISLHHSIDCLPLFRMTKMLIMILIHRILFCSFFYSS